MPRSSVYLAVLLAFSFAPTPAIRADLMPLNYPAPLTATGSISGDITNIDPVNNLIQIKDATGIVQTIRVDDRVQITRRGEVVQLVNLSLGDFVTVRTK